MIKIRCLLILTAAASFFVSGCDLIGVAMTPTSREQKIPAEFELKPISEAGILVLVDGGPAASAGLSFQADLSESIAAHLQKRAKIKGGDIQYHSRVSLAKLFQIPTGQMQPIQIAKKTGQGLVLYTRIEDYSLYQMSQRGYYSGSLTTRSFLYDVQTSKLLWPIDQNGRVIQNKVELDTKGQQDPDERRERAAAYCITRYLYNCQKNQFKIQDELQDFTDEKYW